MSNMYCINVLDITPGMILGESIERNGRLLLSKGTVIKNSYINYLKSKRISEVIVCTGENACGDIIPNPVEKFYTETYDEVKNLLESIKSNNSVDISSVRSIVYKIVQTIFSNKDFLLLLTGFGYACDYYYAHSLDVCIYSVMAAKAMDMEYDEIIVIGMGALLHDIGKVRIPDSILFKPESLSEYEFQVIKNHSIYGYDIVTKIPNIDPRIAEIVLHHHERCDGSGYPLGLTNDRISKYSRLVSIADIYDALTSQRVYRKKILPHEAAEYLLCVSNTLIDQEIAKTFLKNVAIYPKGCQVLLSTDEVAIVIDSNEKMPLRPLLRVITDKHGNPLKLPYVFDLQMYLNVFITCIFN